MPTYKDETTGKWYCKFYYKDLSGNRRQKKKRGFDLKRDAEKFERDFLTSVSLSDKAVTLPWPEFVKLYDEQTSASLAASSRETRHYQYKNHILPAFSCSLDKITPAMIEAWNNSKLENYSQTHARKLYTQLKTIFDYAERVYNLSPNPCKRVKLPTKREHEKDIAIWSLDDYNKAIAVIDDIKAKSAINLLYWSGLRKGELYALLWGDLDGATLTIDKSLQRIGGKSIITPPKTKSSNRKVLLPDCCLELLNEWRSVCYGTADNDFMFPWSKTFIQNGIKQASKLAGVERIRVHDLRHSHASYLISAGANIRLISARLGHSSTSMMLDIYAHLMPTDDKKIIDLINANFRR